MPWDVFLQEVREARKRIESLQADHAGLGTPGIEVLSIVFQELEMASEEMMTAGEELSVQDEELSATMEMARLWRRHYEELFQFAPDGYLITDLQGVIREANQAAADLLGIAAESLVRKPLPNFVALSQRSEFRVKLLQLQKELARQEWDVLLQPRRRRPFDASLTVAAVIGPKGQPEALRWIVRDATARKDAEAQRYRRLLAEVQDYAIIALDAEGCIMTWNAGAERILGYAEAEAMGKPFGFLFTDEDLAAGIPENEMRQAAQTGRASDDRWHRRKDGTRFWASGVLAASLDGTGQARTYIKLLQDATERKKAQERLTADYERERNVAEMLQRTLLPDLPEDAFPGLSVTASYEAAWREAQVGGDFYDAFRIDERRVAFVVGDVSGKGLDAATRTAETKAALRAFLRESGSIADTLRRLNNFVCSCSDFPVSAPDASVEPLTTVALSLVVVDPHTGEAEIAVAGAEPPLLLPHGGDARPVSVRGTLLGAARQSDYDVAQAALQPGDTLVQVTDGITEARSGREFLDYAGLTAIAQRTCKAASLSEIAKRIMDEARAFAGGRFQDDACLLLTRRTSLPA